MVLAVCTQFGVSLDIPLCGIHFTLDGFRAIYGLVVSFMWFVSALLTPQYFRGHHHLRRYHFFFLLCLSFTLGVFLSADLYTTFLFFELMSLSSYAWVVQEESPDALDAGKTYLAIAVLGGLVTLMGLFLLYRLTGTLVMAQLPDACAMVTDRGAAVGGGPVHPVRLCGQGGRVSPAYLAAQGPPGGPWLRPVPCCPASSPRRASSAP